MLLLKLTCIQYSRIAITDSIVGVKKALLFSPFLCWFCASSSSRRLRVFACVCGDGDDDGERTRTRFWEEAESETARRLQELIVAAQAAAAC